MACMCLALTQSCVSIQWFRNYVHTFCWTILDQCLLDYLITSLIQDNVSMLNTGVLSRGVLLLQQEMLVHLQELILQGLDLDDLLFFPDPFVFNFLLEENKKSGLNCILGKRK